MGFGGVYADAEEIGYFFVGFAFGEELENFAFAGSQARACGSVAIGRIDGEIVVAGGRDAGGEVRFMMAGGVNGGEEDAVGFVFENVASGAGLDDLMNEIIGFVHGEDEDFGGRRGGADTASGFDTVEERHADVKDGDVGFEFGGFVYGFAAIRGFGYDFPATARFKERTEASADDRMVIGDQDAKRMHQEAPSQVGR